MNKKPIMQRSGRLFPSTSMGLCSIHFGLKAPLEAPARPKYTAHRYVNEASGSAASFYYSFNRLG